MNTVAQPSRTRTYEPSRFFICPECGGRIQSSSFQKRFGDFESCQCGRPRRKIGDTRKRLCLFGSIENGQRGYVIVENLCNGGVGISTCRSNSVLFEGEEVLMGIFHQGTEIIVKAIVRNVNLLEERAGLQFLYLDEYPDVQKNIQLLVDLGEDTVVM